MSRSELLRCESFKPKTLAEEAVSEMKRDEKEEEAMKDDDDRRRSLLIKVCYEEER